VTAARADDGEGMTTQPVVQTDNTVAVLADGRHAAIRPLGPADAPALIDAIEHEDPWDLRRRFMGAPPPSSRLARQLVRADGIHDLVIGAMTDDGRLVGVAQFDRLDDGADAEVAIEVAHDWQNAGLGTALLSHLALLAQERGVRRFTATYFADNVAIRRLLREVGQVTSSGYDHGEGHACIDLEATA
jgi:RimJ/RimL family protein N-acetyltransferase